MTLDRAVPMRECWGWHGERSPSEIVEAQARIAVTAALSDVIDTDDILSVRLSNDPTVTVTFKAQEIVSVADVQRAQQAMDAVRPRPSFTCLNENACCDGTWTVSNVSEVGVATGDPNSAARPITSSTAALCGIIAVALAL